MLAHRKSRKEPTKAAEYERLNESNDVEELPALNIDAVYCEEDGD